MSPKKLSGLDARVLAQVFDPESAPARAEVLVDPELPADRHIEDAELLQALRQRERRAISIIERVDRSQASSSDRENAYRRSLSILDGLIAEHPKYASALNNRAQLRRWRFGDRNMLCQRPVESSRERSEAASSAVMDLRSAIALASPGRPHDAISPAQGRLLAQSYTQLGALFFAACKDLDTHDVVHINCTFSGWSKERFEEEAPALFYLGGLYGNEVAKNLAVHTNPHAKLCGSIVKEAMRAEIAGASPPVSCPESTFMSLRL